MKASNVIEKLKELIEKHGDQECLIDGPEESGRFKVNQVALDKSRHYSGKFVIL